MKRKILLSCFFVLGALTTFAQVLPPSTPSSPSALQVGLLNQIKVNWNTVSDSITGYRVYYKKNGAAITDSVNVLGRTISTTTLTNLTANSEYTITLAAYRNYLDNTVTKTVLSTRTSPIIVKLITLVKPNSVTVDHAFVTHNSMIVSIKDTNSHAPKLRLEIKEGDSLRTVVIDRKGADTQYPLFNLKPSTFYTFRARALVDSTEGPWSDYSIAAKTQIDVPPAAELKLVSNCPHNVTLNWDFKERANEIASTSVTRSLNNGEPVFIGEPQTHIRTFTDKDANPGSTYSYNILAKNISGQTFSNKVTVNVPAYTAPGYPENITSDQNKKTTTSLTVNWSNPTNVTACRTNVLANTEVAVKINDGAFTAFGNFPIWTTELLIENLKPNDKVEVFFRTHSDLGIISDSWVSITDYTYGPPKAPSGLIGVLRTNSYEKQVLHLSWVDNSPEEDSHFILERSTDGINFNFFSTSKKENKVIVDTDMQEGVSYFYRIQAENWAGKSAFSDIRGPFTLDYTSKPNAPYGLNAKRDGNTVVLTWVDDSINEENFVLDKSTDNGANFQELITLQKNTTRFIDQNISVGNTYVYRVRALNSKGSSAHSKTATIAILNANSGYFDATIFPNPIADVLNLRAQGVKQNSKYSVKIFNQNNVLVVEDEISFDHQNNSNLNVRSLAPGIYNFVLSQGSDKVSKKLVKL